MLFTLFTTSLRITFLNDSIFAKASAFSVAVFASRKLRIKPFPTNLSSSLDKSLKVGSALGTGLIVTLSFAVEVPVTSVSAVGSEVGCAASLPPCML